MQCSKQRRLGERVRGIMAVFFRAVGTAVLLVGLAACSGAQKTPDAGLLAALQQGVNLGDWWTDSAGSSVIRPAHHPTRDDYDHIRKLGFGLVRGRGAGHRLAEGHAGRFSDTHIAALRDDLEAIIQADLAVIVALQMSDEDKLTLFRDPGRARALVRDWVLLADALATLPADSLVLELLNEPTTEDAEAWQALQRKLLAAVREAAPRHTIMLTGAHYADLDDLARLRPVADRNVIYTFHFYTPHNFTHQGADWGWPPWRLLAGLPYPADTERVAPLLDTAPKPARQHIAQYGRETWNRPAISAELSRARLWADQHDVLIHCTEFGVISGAPADSRTRWLTDVRSTLEANQAGWTVWDYAGRFALVDAARTMPVDMKQALGLP